MENWKTGCTDLRYFRLDSRGGQHFAGNALTWADLFLWTVMDLLSVMKVEVNMDKFPKIHNLNCRHGITTPFYSSFFLDRGLQIFIR